MCFGIENAVAQRQCGGGGSCRDGVAAVARTSVLLHRGCLPYKYYSALPAGRRGLREGVLSLWICRSEATFGRRMKIGSSRAMLAERADSAQQTTSRTHVGAIGAHLLLTLVVGYTLRRRAAKQGLGECSVIGACSRSKRATLWRCRARRAGVRRPQVSL